MGWINKQQMNEEKIVCETETLTELPIKTDLGPIPRLFWPSSCTPWEALSFRFAAQLYLLLTLHPIPVMLSHVWLFLTPWTVAHQAPLSMGFSSQEHWSGLSFPPPVDLPDAGIEPLSSAEDLEFWAEHSCSRIETWLSLFCAYLCPQSTAEDKTTPFLEPLFLGVKNKNRLII